jgi:hypothetical protein
VSTQPLDELYFVWLCSQVADPDVSDPSLTYWKLLKQLFTTEFTWRIPNDDNRSEDGKDLRREFIHDKDLEDIDYGWIELGCSVFELMVGLSRRLSFEADGEPHYWFWKLMENLGIAEFSDDRRLPKKRIDETLRRVITRTYEKNGEGGFFPLRNTDEDQRKVELWYQLSAYVLEQDV